MSKKKKSDKAIAYEKKYNDYITSYKTIKTSLKSIVKKEIDIDKINEAVIRTNLIITHTYQFLKLYYLHKFTNDGIAPIINEELVRMIIKILCVKDTRGRKPTDETKLLLSQLKEFYDEQYKLLLPAKLSLSLTNLSQILEYETKNIVACIKTHISEHFEKSLNRYVNVIVHRDENINNIQHMKHYNLSDNIDDYLNGNNTIEDDKNIPADKKLSKDLKKKMIKVYTQELNVLKRDLLKNEDNCDSKYNDIKKQIRKEIIYSDFNNYTKASLNATLIKLHSKIDNLQKCNHSNNYQDFIDKKLCINKPLLENDDFKEYLKEFNKKQTDILINDIIKNNIKNDHVKLVKEKLIEQHMKINIYKKLDSNPLSLLPALIIMNNKIEKAGYKTITAFPIRRSIIPKYINIDTTALIYILFPQDMNKGAYLKKVIKKKEEIWSMFFKTNKPVFKNKRYQFNYQLETDGVACSILLIRKDLYNPNKKTHINHMKKPKSFRSIRYVDELSEKEKDLYREYEIVAIDPGKDDLLYATNGKTEVIQKENGKTTHKITKFTYTQRCRNKETKKKKYNGICENDKLNKVIECKYMDSIKQYDSNENKEFQLYLRSKGYNEMANYVKTHKTVKELESIITNANSKSCDYNNTIEYIKIKNIINLNLENYYKKELYRKLKWYSYINRQKSESRVINKFKEIFGKPDKTVVFFGDYGGGNLKNNEPTKGKGFRKLFHNAGYKIFLTDEYNTSKKNFITGQDNEKFLLRRNPRPYKQGVRLVHGLLRSKTVPINKSESNRHILVNRNLNGSMNILNKTKCILHNIPLPPFLMR